MQNYYYINYVNIIYSRDCTHNNVYKIPQTIFLNSNLLIINARENTAFRNKYSYLITIINLDLIYVFYNKSEL